MDARDRGLKMFVRQSESSSTQVSVQNTDANLGHPADGILDRLVHNAHRIEMRGESMRKKRNPPQDEKKE